MSEHTITTCFVLSFLFCNFYALILWIHIQLRSSLGTIVPFVRTPCPGWTLTYNFTADVFLRPCQTGPYIYLVYADHLAPGIVQVPPVNVRTSDTISLKREMPINKTLWPPRDRRYIYTRLTLCLADAIHNFKRVKIIDICK